jgi:lysozyme
MTPEMQAKLKKSLVQHEGRRKLPYVDTVGKVSIGIGYNLSDRGLPEEWIDTQFQKDIDYIYQKLSQYAWFKQLNEDRQIVILDMSFMGIKNLLEFKDMIYCLEKESYTNAAYAMLDSEWSRQVGKRAQVLAEGLRTGNYEL